MTLIQEATKTILGRGTGRTTARDSALIREQARTINDDQTGLKKPRRSDDWF